MKKISFLRIIVSLIFVFFVLLSTSSHLQHEVTIDDEVAQLIRNVPSAESYPLLIWRRSN